MYFESAIGREDMTPTRRVFVGLSVTALAGCLSEPRRSCSGATVRLSLRPTAAESPLRFDPDALSAEAVGVLETAIEDEHVEHCVSWTPSPDETGPSPGLAAIGGQIESATDIDLAGRIEPVRLDARFDGSDYRLALLMERSG